MKALVTEHLGWGATVTTTEAAAGSIKAEQRRPEGEERKGKTERRRDWEEKNRARQREETQQNREKENTQKKKQRKLKQRNPEKPTLTSPSPQFPPANQKKEEPKQQAVTFIITETKGKQKGQAYTDENEITVPQASSQSPEAGRPFSSSFHSCLKLCNCKNN